MKWYNYAAAFFAGMFLANTVPHFVHGISGDPFPTPFADPPGQGLSTPIVNMAWALFNLLIGYLLLRAGHIRRDNTTALLIFFLGIITAGVVLSLTFVSKVTA